MTEEGYLETQQGAAFARKQAINQSKSTWIGFLDDDTIPALDWVEKVYKFSEAHPKAGAFGSQIQ